MKEIALLVTALLNLLKLAKGSSQRKNLRIVKRTYRSIRREYKKNGFTKDERRELKVLKLNILQRTIDLGKNK